VLGFNPDTPDEGFISWIYWDNIGALLIGGIAMSIGSIIWGGLGSAVGLITPRRRVATRNS
jgi:hypothetical protein